MTKEDKNAVLQYASVGILNEVVETEVKGKKVTSFESIGLMTRKTIPLFMENELLEPFASYYGKCYREIKFDKGLIDLNKYFAIQSLKETVGQIEDDKIRREVDSLNEEGIVTVNDFLKQSTISSDKEESIHIKNLLLFYEGLTFLAFSKKTETKSILIKK